MKILFSTTLPISVAVTLLFWVLLSPGLIFTPNQEPAWNKAVTAFDHLIQFLMAIGEILFSSVTVEWAYILAPTSFIIFYSALIIVLKLTTDIWPYGFMDGLLGTTEINLLNLVLFIVAIEVLVAGLFTLVKYLRLAANGRFCKVTRNNSAVNDHRAKLNNAKI
jgi:hypothetical protein